MMYLKKLFLLTCLTLIVACGDSDAPDVAAPTEATPQSVQQETSTSEPTKPQGPSIAPTAEENQLSRVRGFRDAWTGDLDTMEDNRVIRMLTVYSPGRYYLENGEEKGLVKEMATRFENFINKRLKRKTVRVNVVIIPMARSQLIPALLQGHGDIINASLSITPERGEIMDFSIPATKPLSEILVTGPKAPKLGSIDDLSGRTIYVRQSSSYRESVENLNTRLESAGREPVNIELVSEFLEDDDLIEMWTKACYPGQSSTTTSSISGRTYLPIR